MSRITEMTEEEFKASTRVLMAKDVAKMIRQALKERSGKDWSVTSGDGWIKIHAPKGEQTPAGNMSPERSEELKELMGVENVHRQGMEIPHSYAHHRLYLHRAIFGADGDCTAAKYWD